MVLIADLS